MANKLYPNHVLENRFEDQYNSKLDLMQFCTIDNSLVGTAGDTKKINTYTATNGTQVLEMGEGNTESIEVSYETKEYKIELLQNRFPYFDEEAMNDPLVIEKGLNHMAVDMFNTANAKAMAEFNKATIEIPVTALDFNAFVDGAAALAFEGENVDVFALVHKNDVKEIRKNLKDSLQYVEAYIRTGYIGTVNGVSIYTSNEATEGSPILATKKAVTYFSKKGTEVEQDRESNIRKNTVYSRKYGIFAFTDATQAVRLKKGA
jgi:hypothetical protein